MATIKLTGFNTSTARQSVAGDGDTVELSGSLTIGNADSDTLIVNAEFDSDLIPDDTDTYDLGSASKKWRYGYFDQINAKLRHINTAKFSSTDTSQRYVRWDAAGSNGTPGVNNKFIAPCDGSLISVTIRATSAANGTNIAFHKAASGTANLNTTATETIGVDMSAANTAYQATFSSSSFSAGDILGVSVDPSSQPNDVNVTCVWLFDWNS
jgi:hypothetical protein